MEKTDFKVLMATMGLQIGGAETHVIELCKALKAKGVTVYVASNGGAYESELAECGITHFKVPLHNKKIYNVIPAYFALKKAVSENGIKLVHAHARIPAFLCGLLQRRLHFRFVTTAHFNFINIFPYNLLTNWGEKTIAVSRDLKDYLMKNYKTAEEDILLTINGIDTGKFIQNADPSPFLSEMGIAKDDLKILCVTRLDKEPSRILFPMIEAAEDLCRDYENLKIIIVGDGDNFAAVKSAADKINGKIKSRPVILAGARTDIRDILPCADIFVGISRAALEAMSARRPVILAGGYGYIGRFDESVLSKAFETNFTCRGFEKASKEDLAEAITSLLNEKSDVREHLGSYGREIVRENYSVEKMCLDNLALYETVRAPKKKYDVMLFGYYGSNNSGDDALLKSIIGALREEAPGIKITVLSRKPRQTARTHNVDSIFLFDFISIKKRLLETNTLISGGGTLLQDLTSTRSLMYYLSVMKWARKSGARVMLYANGIGPVRLPKNRERIRVGLEMADCVTLRDEASYALLKELTGTYRVPVHICADAAFMLKAGDCRILPDFMKKLDGKKYYVVSLRKWKYLKGDFCSHIARFCDYMNEKYGMTAVFLLMQPSYDTKISKKVMSMMKSDAKFISGEISTDLSLCLAEKSEFVLSMRLHTIIYAARAFVPSIGIVYDPKVKAMMDILNQNHYTGAAETEFERLRAFGDMIKENRAQLSAGIEKAVKEQTELAGKSLSCAMELLSRGDF